MQCSSFKRNPLLIPSLALALTIAQPAAAAVINFDFFGDVDKLETYDWVRNVPGAVIRGKSGTLLMTDRASGLASLDPYSFNTGDVIHGHVLLSRPMTLPAAGQFDFLSVSLGRFTGNVYSVDRLETFALSNGNNVVDTSTFTRPRGNSVGISAALTGYNRALSFEATQFTAIDFSLGIGQLRDRFDNPTFETATLGRFSPLLSFQVETRVAAVPEQTSAALMLLGLMALLSPKLVGLSTKRHSRR